MDKNEITACLENYLEIILEHKESNNKVRVTDLARTIGIAKSTVNQAIEKLSSMGYLTHEKYGPLELTSLGEEHAKLIKKRHYYLKKFLTEVLGVNSIEAEKDACSIEHVISSQTTEKLIQFIEKTEK